MCYFVKLTYLLGERKNRVIFEDRKCTGNLVYCMRKKENINCKIELKGHEKLLATRNLAVNEVDV
jgi:hypothetical protein